jgi:hypothetical protein
MNPSKNHLLFFLIPLILTLACGGIQPTPDSAKVINQVATSVALTVTALSKTPPITNTPLPTPTEVVSPTPTLIPTMSIPVITPTVRPGYACDIIDQKPYDDEKFRPNDRFDIKWTISNTGTKRWEEGTYLRYQSGSEMTNINSVEMPKLKPGQQYEVILEATAPAETDRQVMVWAVIGPEEKDGPLHWMCYPYIRIIVGK